MADHRQPAIRHQPQAKSVWNALAVGELPWLLQFRDQRLSTRKRTMAGNKIVCPVSEIVQACHQARCPPASLGGERPIGAHPAPICEPVGQRPIAIAAGILTKITRPHSERLENMVPDIGCERFPRRSFDQRCEQNIARIIISKFLARREVGGALTTEEGDAAVKVVIVARSSGQFDQPPYIAQAAGVMHQLFDRDRGCVRHLRQISADRIIERKMPLAGRHRHRSRGELLCDRADAENLVRHVATAGGGIGEPECAAEYPMTILICSEYTAWRIRLVQRGEIALRLAGWRVGLTRICRMRHHGKEDRRQSPPLRRAPSAHCFPPLAERRRNRSLAPIAILTHSGSRMISGPVMGLTIVSTATS